jgi:hypothetical protein
MFRHVVLLTWKPEASDSQVTALREGLAKLPGQIPEIADYHFGDDAGINDGNYAFAITADFASADDYRVYRDAPVHRELIATLVAPIVATRAAVQFQD